MKMGEMEESLDSWRQIIEGRKESMASLTSSRFNRGEEDRERSNKLSGV
jgi:hypothetical protein